MRDLFERPLVLAADMPPDALADAAVNGIDRHGVVRINSVLKQRTTEELLSHINGVLEEALASARDFVVMDEADVYVQRFGAVLARQGRNGGTTTRHDVKLELTPPVTIAVEELLQTLGPTLSKCLGADAVLYELSALISDPGSVSQPYHPDTPHRDDQGLAVLTAFVALQPIDEQMGPTHFLPFSHSAEDHAKFNAKDGDGEAVLSLLRSRPCYRGLLGAGDVSLFDSRVLHCGGANDSNRRRVLFYASFKAKGAKVPPGTLLYEMRDRHALADFWSSGA